MGRTEVRASGRVAGLASVRLTMSTYHVDLPKSTTATPCRYWGRARNGLSLKSVKPESSISVPAADVPLRLDAAPADGSAQPGSSIDRKSTRLNSSHLGISYAVFCLKKK